MSQPTDNHTTRIPSWARHLHRAHRQSCLVTSARHPPRGAGLHLCRRPGSPSGPKPRLARMAQVSPSPTHQKRCGPRQAARVPVVRHARQSSSGPRGGAARSDHPSEGVVGVKGAVGPYPAAPRVGRTWRGCSPTARALLGVIEGGPEPRQITAEASQPRASIGSRAKPL